LGALAPEFAADSATLCPADRSVCRRWCESAVEYPPHREVVSATQ